MLHSEQLGELKALEEYSAGLRSWGQDLLMELAISEGKAENAEFGQR